MNNRILSFCLLLLFTFLQGCSLVDKEESNWTVQDYYSHAKEAFDNEQWDSAIKYYEKLQAYYPYGQYAEQSYLDLAFAYYRYGEPESAVQELDQFIHLYPKHKSLPYAYYLKALAADSINKSWLDSWLTDPARRDMASTKKAFDAYSALVQLYPNSSYAPYSRQRLVVLRNRLARHQYQVARYYYKRQAYLASANRCVEVVKKYPRSEVRMKALKLMLKNYQNLGMTQNAKNTQEVIQYNKVSTSKTTESNIIN